MGLGGFGRTPFFGVPAKGTGGSAPPTPTVSVVNSKGWTATGGSPFALPFTPTVGNVLLLFLSGTSGVAVGNGTLPSNAPPLTTGIEWNCARSADTTGSGQNIERISVWVGVVKSAPGTTISFGPTGSDSYALVELLGSDLHGGGMVLNPLLFYGENSTSATGTLDRIGEFPVLALAFLGTRGSPYGAVTPPGAPWTTLVAANGAIDPQGAVVYQVVPTGTASVSATFAIQASGGGFTTDYQLLCFAIR